MNQRLPGELLDRLCSLGSVLPQGLCNELVMNLRRAQTSADGEMTVAGMLTNLLPENRRLLSDIVAMWRQAAAMTSGNELAAVLEAATYQEKRLRSLESIELVWTGPSHLQAGFRSTGQVVLDLIKNAKQSIYLVTFAAYKVDGIVAALSDAISRNVEIALILEDREESGGKVNFNALKALAGDYRQSMKVYVWPLEQRPRNAEGQRGTLHAKCVLADGDRLFVSSANMTSYALDLNMELGALINGGAPPRQLHRNLLELIRTGVLREQADQSWLS